MGKKIDLTGQRFGFLTVVEPVESIVLKNGKPRTRWLCKCDCGKTIITATNNLKNGTSISCGCERKKRAAKARYDMMKEEEGKKYNLLTIIKTFRKNNKTYADFICECGTKGTTKLDFIKSGHTCSCGCKKNDSKMEKECCDLLNKLNVNFARQYMFADCMYRSRLKFDFAIFDKNNCLICLIECQGIQHYVKQPNGFGDEQRDITDPIKRKYCEQNNIKLYEIKYNESVKNQIDIIIKECKAILCQAE